MNFYTLGIKRKWWFGYKKYQVTAHHLECVTVKNIRIGEDIVSQMFGFKPKFILSLHNGDELSIPGFEDLNYKLYSDYDDFMAIKKAQHETKEKPAGKIAVVKPLRPAEPAPIPPNPPKEAADGDGEEMQRMLRLRKEIASMKEP